MKKLVCVLVALLLLALFPAMALSDDLYDQYGDMEEWGEEDWLASEEWSDEQWEDYWQGAEDAYNSQWQQQKQEMLKELGAPDPDGVNVKLNEAFLIFTGAKPLLIDGDAYLPLRGFLAAAGVEAKISYDAVSRSATVTLADDSQEVFTVAKSPDEEEEEEDHYYYAYNNAGARLVEGVMYVRDRSLCYFLGWDISWDYYYDILYIVDPKPLIEVIDSNFSIINRLLKGSVNLDLEQSYKIAGSAGFVGALYGEDKPDAISASFSYTGLRSGFDMDINFSIQLDLSQMQDSIFSGLDAETWRVIKAVSAGKGRVILNIEEGSLYLQSNLLPLLDKSLSATDWLKVEYPAEELSTLLSADIFRGQADWFSLGLLIYQSSSNSYYYNNYDIYAETLKTAKMWQALLGDENFSQTRGGGYDVFALNLNKKEIPNSSESSLFSLFGYLGYGYGNEDTAHVSGLLRFREKDGYLEDMEIKAAAQTPGAFPMAYTLNYSGSSTKYQGYLEIKGRYLGKLLLSSEYEAEPTSELPASAPPEGSHVVDWQDANFGSSYILL